MKKIIFILVLLLLIGVGFYFWKNVLHVGVNRPQEQGLYFDRPADWKFEVVKQTDEQYSARLTREDETQGKVDVYGDMLTPTYYIDIASKEVAPNLTSHELYLSNFVESAKEEAAANLKEATVDGVAAVEYTEGTAPSSGPATGVLVVKDGREFRFVYSAMATAATHEKFLPAFYELIKSVKL